MPPFCNKCQAHLLFDHDQTKKLMITNVERWLECNMNDESRGKILFISSTPTNIDASNQTSPRVLIELTPRLSSRGEVSFTFNEVDVEERHIVSVESSLSETIEVLSPQNKGFTAQYSNRDQVSTDFTLEQSTMDDAANDIQLVNTESEEREILQRYPLTRAVATKSISKHLKKGYELTTDLCDRCQMPMMQLGDRAIYCIVCPVIDKEAKRNARRKRKIIQNNQSLPTTHYVQTLSSDTQTTEESRPKLVVKSSRESENSEQQQDKQQQLEGNMYRLTALEEGLGFIWSPRNQEVVNLAVSSCMSMDDNEPTAHRIETSDDVPLVYHSQSIAEQGSYDQVQQRQLLDQLSYSASYSDNVSNQHSVGVECTYSVHQMYLSQHRSMDGVTSTNSSSPSNIMQQTSSISETQCPRNLPSGEMIWHPEVQSSQCTNAEYNKNATLKGPMQTSRTANDFIFSKESFEPQTVVAVSSEGNNLAGPELIRDEQVPFPESAVEMGYNKNEDGIAIDHYSISKPIEKESIATRIARLSSSMEELAEETRGDKSTQRTTRDGSDLGSANQKSFDGPLLTPDMINCPVHADREARDTNIQHAPSFTVQNEHPCERERCKTVRVFGMVVAQSPRAQKQKGDPLPPLFPSPKASPQRQGTDEEQNLAGGVQQGGRELAILPQESVDIKEEKVSLLFPPPQDSLALTSISNRDIVSPSLRGRDIGMSIGKSLEAEKQEPIFEPSQKAVDPPGKRLSKRREGDPIDPPAFAGTPKRGNFAKPKRKQKGHPPSVDKPAYKQRPKPIGAFGSNKPRSKSEPKSNFNSISSSIKEDDSLVLTIPTWVDDEINSPLKTSRSFGDSSVEKLIQQIDDLEADFGSIVALMPGSSATTLNTTKSPISTQSEEQIHRRKTEVNGSRILKISDAETASQAKLDNDASDDSVFDNITQKIRKVHLQIEQMDSSDDLDCDEILGTASQEEMLELINRLNNAAQSLKTFSDFH
ncbi:hypothetical protein ACHAWC_003818 [Mediolabrus comicus]